MAFRSLVILSALVSTVLAQSSSYIPSGISTTCSNYLTSLNTNTGFVGCTKPFTTALAQFAPGANTPSISPTIIDTVLGQLCNTTAFSACPQSTVTTELSAFYAACSPELTSTPNAQVKSIYDVLFSLIPLRQSICAKDDNGTYCAANLNANSQLVGSGVSNPQTLLSQYLYSTLGTSTATRRDASNSTPAIVPNATTYEATNLLFMFLQPSMATTQLCTTCTRNILTPWITFGSNNPYGPGIINSLLLAGQVALYQNITAKCPSGFLSGAVQAAGGLSSGLLSGAAPRVAGQELTVAVSAILGVAAFVAAFL